MNALREKIAKWMAPGLKSETEIRAIVKEEVLQARQAWPVSLDYDPHNEGYRRLSSEGQENARRDLTPMGQDTMLELAYYLYDTSGLVKRFVRDTKNFTLGEGVSYVVDNDDEAGSAAEVLDETWADPMNDFNLRLEQRIEFLNLLGEQCYPVAVNPHNGRVWESYVDPVNIDVVEALVNFPEIPAAVKLKGTAGRQGRMLSVIREETDPRKKEFGRLVGDCFFFAINKPPNATRGRSDLIHLFDFVNGFEEGLFDELDRIKGIKAFIWDVTLKGATKEEIAQFLKDNKTPKSNSVRAHNDQVVWDAVAPTLNATENKAIFDLMRTYLSACANRPDSWLGSGGKAYQTEADLMGEPTFKDLGSRQRYVKYIIEYQLRYVLDQATLAGRISAPKGEKWGVTVNMPEMSAKDLKKIVDGLFTLAQSLMIAEAQGWVTKETAASLYANMAERSGMEIDAAEEIKKAAQSAKGKGKVEEGTEDYAAREAMIREITARLEAKGSKLRAVV